jgi:hypothetical protein
LTATWRNILADLIKRWHLDKSVEFSITDEAQQKRVID